MTPDGTAKVCNFGIASNERWTDQQTGELRETVCFVEIEAWNRQAELVFEHFKKGSPILIEGNLKFDSWQADDGTNRSRLKVRLQRFEFMARRTDEETPQNDSEPTANPYINPPVSDEQPPF